MMEKDHQLDEFLEKYRKLIINNAYSYVDDYYTAEDICQETFLRYYRCEEKIEERKVKAWLLEVSRHLAIDHMRKGGKYKTDVGLEPHVLETKENAYPDPCSILEKKEVEKIRFHVLERLKEEKPIWYEAIVLSVLDDKDNKEIGQIMGVSPSLVSKWKERGKQWLRNKYEIEEERRSRKRIW